jgi:hypothetical protein
MRLGQLARKLALRPAEIVDYLAENNIRIAEGTNTRLENDQVNLIMKRFVPGWIESPEQLSESEDEGVLAETVEPLDATDPITDAQSLAVDEPVKEDQQAAEGIEVIRAPKVELSGLKVVGKIDLPEPKKKEEPPKDELSSSDTTVPAEVTKERREPRKQFDKNKRRFQRVENNPIALQREREAKEAEKKRQEQLARDKEKRTQKYLQNYKPAPPTKAAKLVKEDVIEMTPQDLVEPPKTIFGKILRWLTKAS